MRRRFFGAFARKSTASCGRADANPRPPARCVNVDSPTSATVLDLEEMPSPKGLPFLGTTLSLLAAGSTPKLHEYVDKRHAQLGAVFKDSIGPVSAVFVSDPEEMRLVFHHEGKYPVHVLPQAWTVYNRLYGRSRGLFFMDGPEWLSFRRTMNGLLLKGDQGWIEAACETVSLRTVERFGKLSDRNGGVVPDLENELYRWSLEVLLAVLLGPEDYARAENLDSLTSKLATSIHSVFTTSAKLSLIPADFAARFRIPRWNRFVKSVDEALGLSSDLVTKLIADFRHGDGLLAKMLDEGVAQSDVVRIVADLVMAAGDTTAYSMQWLLYLTAKNQSEQDRLFESLSSDASAALLKNMVREALRLYPVAPFLTRFLPKDCTIGGYSVPQGTLIILSLYTSGRDPRNFKDPKQFNPDRWSRNDLGTANLKASMPFALGARSCIGRRIAEAQLRRTLADLVGNFRISCGNREEVGMVLRMVAVPDQPVRLIFDRR